MFEPHLTSLSEPQGQPSPQKFKLRTVRLWLPDWRTVVVLWWLAASAWAAASSHARTSEVTCDRWHGNHMATPTQLPAATPPGPGCVGMGPPPHWPAHLHIVSPIWLLSPVQIYRVDIQLLVFTPTYFDPNSQTYELIICETAVKSEEYDVKNISNCNIWRPEYAAKCASLHGAYMNLLNICCL